MDEEGCHNRQLEKEEVDDYYLNLPAAAAVESERAVDEAYCSSHHDYRTDRKRRTVHSRSAHSVGGGVDVWSVKPVRSNVFPEHRHKLEEE